MKVKELKNKSGYEFECNMSKEEFTNLDNDVDMYDEWGCAFAWLGDNGVEYNFCIDNSTNESVNCCAIYKTVVDTDSGYFHTDSSTFVHYEIDFNNEHWEEELENAMCKALIEFHGF